ncbi:hypothetical protein CUMW_255430, partial [Citrus unshiu]
LRVSDVALMSCLDWCPSLLTVVSTSALSSSYKINTGEFPEKTSSRDQLLELHLEGTAIRGLPASIELFPGNVLLNLKDCKNLKSRPSTINVPYYFYVHSYQYLRPKDSDSWKKNVDKGIGLLTQDSDSWKKNVDKIQLSTTAISACLLACHRLIQTSRAMPKS